MGNIIADFFLFFQGQKFLLLFELFGFYFISRRIFLNTLMVTFFASFLAAYLKYHFQVPLNPALGKFGWSYPSGHTVFNTVLWGTLAIQIRKLWVYIVSAILLPAGMVSMVYKGYHIWPDILGGVCAAGLVLIPFYYWIRYKAEATLILGMLLLPLSLLIYFYLPHHLLQYDWVEFMLGSYIGILAILVINSKEYCMTRKQSIACYFLGVMIVAVIFMLTPIFFWKGLLIGTCITALPLLFMLQRKRGLRAKN